MTKSIIKQLFYGERGYADVAESPKETELVRSFEACDRQVREAIGDEALLALYNAAVAAHKKLTLECCDNHYAQGFATGVLVGLEIAELNK